MTHQESTLVSLSARPSDGGSGPEPRTAGDSDSGSDLPSWTSNSVASRLNLNATQWRPAVVFWLLTPTVRATVTVPDPGPGPSHVNLSCSHRDTLAGPAGAGAQVPRAGPAGGPACHRAEAAGPGPGPTQSRSLTHRSTVAQTPRRPARPGRPATRAAPSGSQCPAGHPGPGPPPSHRISDHANGSHGTPPGFVTAGARGRSARDFQVESSWRRTRLTDWPGQTQSESLPDGD